MTDLRKAAEMALEALEDVFGLEKKDVAAIQALRQALAQPVDAVNMKQECVDELKECVHEFFTKYLNHVEESDSGGLFNPITIGCCRALMLEPLNELLERMRVLSGADRNPLSADGQEVTGEVNEIVVRQRQVYLFQTEKNGG